MHDLKSLKKFILRDIAQNHSNILVINFFNSIKIYDFIQYQNRVIKNKIYLTFECKNQIFIYEAFVNYNPKSQIPIFTESKLTKINANQLLEWKKQFLMGI